MVTLEESTASLSDGSGEERQLAREHVITYECGAGGITQAEFPTAYTIGRDAPAVLPTQVARAG